MPGSGVDRHGGLAVGAEDDDGLLVPHLAHRGRQRRPRSAHRFEDDLGRNRVGVLVGRGRVDHRLPAHRQIDAEQPCRRHGDGLRRAPGPIVGNRAHGIAAGQHPCRPASIGRGPHEAHDRKARSIGHMHARAGDGIAGRIGHRAREQRVADARHLRVRGLQASDVAGPDADGEAERVRLPGRNVDLRVLPDQHVREVQDRREGRVQFQHRVADLFAHRRVELCARIDAREVGEVEVESALVHPVAQAAVHRHADVGRRDVERAVAVVLDGQVDQHRVGVGRQRVLAVDGRVQRRRLRADGEDAGHERRFRVVAGGAEDGRLAVAPVVDHGDAGALGGAEVEADPHLAPAAFARKARVALPVGGGDRAAVRVVAVGGPRVLDHETDA